MNNNFLFDIDSKFIEFYGNNLKQVFLYITDECNLSCKQCLYKPNTVFHVGKGYINSETAIALISDFRKMGAYKLTIIGGEPSLYGRLDNHQPLIEVIKFAKKVGYEYIRLDTNGQFKDPFLELRDLKLIDEIAFSLDGFSKEIHDYLRGDGAFLKCTRNITKATQLGFNITITTCVHRKLVEKDDNGNYLLDSMIKFAETLKASGVNFHALFKHAFPLDTWTEETNIDWKTWLDTYQDINKNIKNNKYNIKVRLPQHFVTQEEFNKNRKYYGYCAVKLRERILVHPNGILRICSGLLGSQYGIGKFYDRKIVWDKSGTNETLDHKYNKFTPCTNQSKGMECGEMLPICFSLKPYQDELVWNKLGWDKLKKEN